MKTGLVAATGITGLSTASFAQNNENSNYVITLTAVDQDGNPLQGKATVIGSADGDIIGERELDEDGQATWEVSQEGEYSYNVYDVPGYEEASEDTSFEVDRDTDITAEMEKEDSQVDDGNTITVTVLDENDEPLTDANVSVVASDDGDEIASGDTDSDGTVSFDIESGEYEVIVNHDDVIGPASTSVTVDDGDTDVSVTLDTTNGRATGIIRVVDQNGDPVKGEPVTVWPPGTVEEEGTETHETNADGEVVIELRSFEPTDAVMFDVEVRDQEQTLGIMSDAENGVQETVFEVETSDDDEDSVDDDDDEASIDDGDSDDSDDEDDDCAKVS